MFLMAIMSEEIKVDMLHYYYIPKQGLRQEGRFHFKHMQRPYCTSSPN